MTENERMKAELGSIMRLTLGSTEEKKPEKAEKAEEKKPEEKKVEKKETKKAKK